jgi:uncharacterized protein
MSDRRFSPDVAERLGYYVYRLEDPRDNGVFYVGKGTDDRCFQHAEAALLDGDTPKLSRIRDIHAAGQRPRIVIHRHGLDEVTAFQVEAALIDAYSGLLNEVGGRDIEYGATTPEELMERYGAEPAEIVEPSILIKIEREWKSDLSPEQLYERTRRYWVCSPDKRRRKPRYAIAVARGIIREVYEIDEWEDYPKGTIITPDSDRIENEPFTLDKDRKGFFGRAASTMAHLKGTSVFHLRRKSAQNPIKYVNC